MAQIYPKPSPIFTFKGFMGLVHCVIVHDNILFAGTQEGKVHLWCLKTYREINILLISSQPILSIHNANSNLLFQDKEGTVFVFKEIKNSCPKNYKEINNYKRIEAALSFCKCIVFEDTNGDIQTYYNVLGQSIAQGNDLNINKLNINNDGDVSNDTGLNCMNRTSNEIANEVSNDFKNYYLIIPYNIKEITLFSLETRKKLTKINLLYNNKNNISDNIMCMKLINLNNQQPYLIICSEDGQIILYNIKLKYIESQIKLNKKQNEDEDDMNNLPDVPMAIDFDNKTMRGLIGTNSNQLYCFKIYEKKLNDNSECCNNAEESKSYTYTETLSNCSEMNCQNKHSSNSKGSKNFKCTENQFDCSKLEFSCNSKNIKDNIRTEKHFNCSEINCNTDNISSFKGSKNNTYTEQLNCSQIKYQNKSFLKSYENQSNNFINNKINYELKTKMIFRLKNSGVSCISIRNDSKIFLISYWDGNGIYIYDWKKMKCISSIDYVYNSISNLYYFNENNMLAIADDGGKVTIWKMYK